MTVVVALEVRTGVEGSTAFLKERKTPTDFVLLCPQDMVWDIKYKTVRWSFVESLEPPQVVQVRCSNLLNQGNIYGQVTVRMHTRQVDDPFCFPPNFSSLSGWVSISGVMGTASQDCGLLRKGSPWSSLLG